MSVPLRSPPQPVSWKRCRKEIYGANQQCVTSLFLGEPLRDALSRAQGDNPVGLTMLPQWTVGHQNVFIIERFLWEVLASLEERRKGKDELQ